MQVRLFESTSDGRQWNDFVTRTDKCRVFHRWEWRDIYASAFGFRPRFWAATEGDEIVGILPGIVMRGLDLRRTWVSLPFVQAAGPVHTRSEAGGEFVARVVEQEHLSGIGRFQLRAEGQPARLPGDWSASDAYVTMILPLDTDPVAVWKQALDGERRRQVRNARKKGLESVSGRLELLDDFYRIWTARITELGTPVYPRQFFRRILETFGDDAWIMAVRLGDATVGARLVLRTGDRVHNVWAATAVQYYRMGANALLYWAIIERACELGCRAIDMGRSQPGGGTYVYKKSWGATPLALTYYYAPQTNAAEHASSKYRMLIELWRRQPLALARALGPPLTRFLTDL